MFRDPAGMAVNAAGIVYIADSNNHLIRKISPNGTVVTMVVVVGVVVVVVVVVAVVVILLLHISVVDI